MAIKPIQILINAKDNASGVFSSLQAKIVGLGVAIAGYFGFQAFSGAIKGAADLEAKMSEVQAISGATADELKAMRDAAEEAGATTNFTATEAAEALGNLARAGLSAGDSVKALKPSLLLAQAGNIGLAESSEIVTKTLAGFGFAAEEAGRIADVLAQGANASNTSVTGLGQALSYAAPTAVSLGLSLEETVAIIGKFADAGIDASRAGTALNSILAQFSNPASLFRKELAAAGISTNDFGQALRELEARGPAGSKAILAVGQEAGPALRALLNQGTGALDELVKKLEESKGSAKSFADIVRDNLKGELKGLESIWESVGNVLGQPVLPVLRDGVVQLTEALRSAVKDGTVGRFGEAIAKGFQAALTWVRAFIAEVDFGALAAKISSAADQVGDAFTRVATYAKTAGDVTKTAWGVMSAGADVVLAAIYGIGAAMAAAASTMQEQIAKILSGLGTITFGGVSASFKEAADDMRISAEATLAAAGALGDKAKQSLLSVADGAELARQGWAGLTAETETAVAKAEASNTVFQQLGDTLTEAGDKAKAMGEKTEKALSKTEAAAAAAALAVTKAFSDMGIQTQAELEIAAKNARANFDLIYASGQATASGLSDAFKKYAEASIAANDGVASSALKAEAFARGLQITADASGKAIVSAMDKARRATDEVGRSARSASKDYGDMGKSAEQAAASAKKLAEVNRRYSKPGESSTQQGNEPNYDPGRNAYGRAGQNDQPRNGNGQTQAEFQRSEKLQGQGASDETLRFGLLEKLNKGTLTESDLGDLKNVVATLRENQRMFDSLGIGTADNSTLRDDQKWQAIQGRFQQAIDKFEGQSGVAPKGEASVGRTVNFNFAIGSRDYGSAATDEQGASNLESFLDALARGKGTAQ